ncbi:MAG: hypothetical protein COZ69_02745 [Deltaproteobacteria bacterium CG_4_8_14_3_um_filter_45_9]|nr:MAG: hypothetical protein COS40_01130 [Deltaproteobacteria bacterium CG03_land_8_20_14_0_80_45_14]PIX25579.1 MAG: hypothetical protein COZ69_02745 [Deltaproteobacteria bacterium CG_4_8_14_3_um_filter_45_9]
MSPFHPNPESGDVKLHAQRAGLTERNCQEGLDSSEKGFKFGDNHGLGYFKEKEELLLGLMDSFEFGKNERVSIKKLI